MIAVGLNPDEVGGGHVVMMMPPEGMANCDPLAVVLQRTQEGSLVCVSRWEPSEEERRQIAAGGDILLYVWGHQVPVALGTITTEAGG